MIFKFDQIEGFRVRINAEMVEIVRPCMVLGIPVAEGASDPEVLLKITEDAACPQPGNLYPTTIARYANCALQDYAIRSRKSNNSAIVDFIYRVRSAFLGGSGPADPSTWSLTDSVQISHIENYSSAGGLRPLQVWYKKGASTSAAHNISEAADEKPAVKAHKMKTYRLLRARGVLTGADWVGLAPSIYALGEKINSDDWGPDSRGKWYFVGPTTTTTDYGATFVVQLDFLREKDGHFPIEAYFNSQGKRPDDVSSESELRAHGLPAEGDAIHGNGLSLWSEYTEAAFSPVFAFHPLG